MWKSQLIWIGDLVIASQRLEQEHKKKTVCNICRNCKTKNINQKTTQSII